MAFKMGLAAIGLMMSSSIFAAVTISAPEDIVILAVNDQEVNAGILRTKKDNVSLSYLVRSSIESEKNSLIEKMRSLTEIFGGRIVVSGEYPGWAYREDSKLRDIAVEAYRKLYNEEPV